MMVARLRRLQDLGSREVRWFVCTINTCEAKSGGRVRQQRSSRGRPQASGSVAQDAQQPHCPWVSLLAQTRNRDGVSVMGLLNMESGDLKIWNLEV